MTNDPSDNTAQLNTLDLSKLHRYSFGVVVEDNVDNEFKIKVYPVEKLYSIGGDLSKEDKWIQKKIKERKVKKTEEFDPLYIKSLEDITINRTRYLYANWIKDNNQITPPNVCKGEYITLYRYSNRDEYYWSVELTDLTLRKEEHVVYTFSDKSTLDKSEDPIEDRYTVTFSPKNKEVKIHTTDKYGEYTKYDITIKTDDGYIEILDGKKNSIKLDSTKDMLHTHMEGTTAKYDITVHGDDGYIETKDDKGNNIKLDSSAGSLTTNILNNVDIKTNLVNIDCSSFSLKSDAVSITSSATTFKGGTIKHDGTSIDKLHEHTGNLGINTSPPVN